ncbi:cytidine deaminase [Holzapfeliella sp. He02]|uniref:Cytidine deaminase n=1 Tax=Holzapfeliella saturejae TaxID=3082953 RepID=A0ABU8SHU8_9LACO
MEIKQLIEIAKQHLSRAYVPYSHFPVAAVALDDQGNLYKGINVENASYGLTMCAERVCLFESINQNDSKPTITDFVIIGNTPNAISPCGACRQVMSELLNRETRIVLASAKTDDLKQFSLDEILPYYFTSEELNNGK